MKWLSIDCMKEPASFSVCEDGRHFGTLRVLDEDEIPVFAKWLGLAGGKSLLDSFEVALINSGALRMLHVYPHDADGDPIVDESNAMAIEHHDSGSRILWEPKVKCESCGGRGHFADDCDPVTEEDVCLYCDGDGFTHGAWITTDMDGLVISELGT